MPCHQVKQRSFPASESEAQQGKREVLIAVFEQLLLGSISSFTVLVSKLTGKK